MSIPMWAAALLAALTLASLGCRHDATKSESPKTAGVMQFHNVSASCGIDFVHNDGSSGRRFIVEPMSAGLALFDYDGDGLIDIYFLNGAAMPGTQLKVPPRNRLYRNLGDWQFRDVTDHAGVGDTGFGLGVTVGDYNNDGFQDLYLNNQGPNVFYQNNGDGTFTDITTAAGVRNGAVVGAGAGFLDMDADGDLDLYVANYLKFELEKHVPRMFRGHPSYPSPRDFLPVPDALFRNNGDGSFTDVSKASGVASVAGTGMGMICADCDDDGDTDVFVLNDVAENFFFQNDGRGNFEEAGTLVGLAYNNFGDENASMGVDSGDMDNDGLVDFFMTSYQGELPVYYHNLGGGLFEDMTQRTRAGITAFPYVNWGVGLVDFDNDMDLDIFIANGHTEDNVDLYDNNTSYKAQNFVLMNTGTGREFVDVSDQCGDGLQPVKASRGAGFDDLDNNGTVDCVIQNSREAPTILRNDTRNANHWLEIRLYGTQASRDAVGSKVLVHMGAITRVAEVHAGRGYQSHFGTRLYFGLGSHHAVDQVEVHWLGGGVDRVGPLDADQRVVIIQGHGQRHS